MINQKQLIKHVFYKAVEALGFDDGKEDNAVALLAYTCSQESEGGKYITQMGNGPARGIMQIEPATYYDCISNYLSYREHVIDSICGACEFDSLPSSEALTHNLMLSACIARVQYRRSPPAIPEWNDLEGMWAIYKKYYNTHLGKATKEEFMHNAERVIEFLK